MNKIMVYDEQVTAEPSRRAPLVCGTLFLRLHPDLGRPALSLAALKNAR